MKRLITTAVAAALLIVGCSGETPRNYDEHDISTLQRLMERGDLTARGLVEYYLDRIDATDRNGPSLSSIIELNPDALDIADSLDRERQESGPRGPLHGIPVVLKANIDTGDKMATTAGSLALAGHRPPDDAFLVKAMREAGGIRVWFADRRVIYWHSFQRENADRNRLRFRTGRHGAPSAADRVA